MKKLFTLLLCFYACISVAQDSKGVDLSAHAYEMLTKLKQIPQFENLEIPTHMFPVDCGLDYNTSYVVTNMGFVKIYSNMLTLDRDLDNFNLQIQLGKNDTEFYAVVITKSKSNSKTQTTFYHNAKKVYTKY